MFSFWKKKDDRKTPQTLEPTQAAQSSAPVAQNINPSDSMPNATATDDTERQKKDLEKLMAFQNKIRDSEATLSSEPAVVRPEELGLKLNNPFRGV